MDFYFVDERGNDSTNFETITNKGQIEKYKIASKYFQIGVLKINSKNLFLFQEHLNCIRYFLNISKELERLLSSKNALSKLWAIIESTFYNIECRYLSGFICKLLMLLYRLLMKRYCVKIRSSVIGQRRLLTLLTLARQVLWKNKKAAALIVSLLETRPSAFINYFYCNKTG